MVGPTAYQKDGSTTAKILRKKINELLCQIETRETVSRQQDVRAAAPLTGELSLALAFDGWDGLWRVANGFSALALESWRGLH